MRWLAWVSGTLLTLALTLHTLPYLVRDQVVLWLLNQGVAEARLKSIDVNWWRGEVQLHQLRVRRDGHYPLDLDLLKVRIDYAALLHKQVRLRTLDVEGLDSGFAQQKEQQWLGPLDLTALSAQSSAPAEQPVPSNSGSAWSIGLDGVALSGIDWYLNLDGQEQHLQLSKLRLGAIYLWQPDLETPLQFSGKLNGAPFSLESVSVPLPSDKRAELRLKLDKLPVQSLTAPFLPQLKAELSTDLRLKVDLSGDDLQLTPSGSIDIADLGWTTTALSASVPVVHWQGDAAVTLKASQPDLIRVNGDLTLPSGVKLQQAKELSLALQRLGWQGELRLTPAATDAQQLNIDGKLDAGALALNQNGSQPLHLQLATAGWNGKAQLTLPKQGAPDLATDQALSLKQLQLALGKQLDMRLGDASLKAQVNGTGMAGWSVKNGSVSLASLNVDRPAGGQAQLQKLQGQFGADVDTASGQVKANVAALGGQGLALQLANQPLATMDQFQLQALRFSTPQQLNIDKVRLQGMAVAKSQLGPPLLASQGIALDRLALDQQQLTIAGVDISGLALQALLGKEGQPVDVQSLQQRVETLAGSESGASPAVSAAAKPSAAQQNSALRVRIGTLALSGKSQVHFEDRSTKPVFKADLALSKAQVKSIDTGGSTPSPFQLEGTVNRFAKLQAKGALNLVGAPRSGHWQVNLSDLELPAISPYAIKYTGYYLKSGQLSLDLKGTLDKDKLDGQNQIRLHRLAVDPADRDQIAKFQQQISMPLGTAVAVLQDSNDNIDLSVPISGSLDDPQFDYQSIIKRIAGKGVRQGVMSYLTQMLQPYGALISLAQTAIKASQTGAFIHLEPVMFNVGTAEPASGTDAYLAQLTKLMTDRTALRLNLCGITVAEDRQVLQEALAAANKKSKKPLDAKALAQKLQDQVQALASHRAERLKASLQQRKIASDRLFLCYPQLDQPGKPRVELAL